MSRESNDGSSRRGGKTTHVLSASGSATGTCAANSPPVGVQLSRLLTKRRKRLREGSTRGCERNREARAKRKNETLLPVRSTGRRDASILHDKCPFRFNCRDTEPERTNESITTTALTFIFNLIFLVRSNDGNLIRRMFSKIVSIKISRFRWNYSMKRLVLNETRKTCFYSVSILWILVEAKGKSYNESDNDTGCFRPSSLLATIRKSFLT